jgi:hypothetical protein
MMPETPEAAMRRTCNSIMQGDLMSVVQDLTPEVLNDLMMQSTNITSVPSARGYDIEAHNEVDGEHSFDVRFRTDAQDIVAHFSWRDFGGEWKIVALSADGLED